MKRRVKERRKTPIRVYDVRTELPKETLAAFGSCTLLFNEMQASLDTLLCLCLNIDPNGWRELTTRIGGLDQKTELCNFWLANTFKLSPSLLKQIVETLASFTECKGYRDTAIHCRIVDPDNSIAEMAIKRNRLDEIIINDSALNALYGRMFATLEEMDALIALIEVVRNLQDRWSGAPSEDKIKAREIARMVEKGDLRGMIKRLESDPDGELTAQEVRGAMATYLRHYRRRKALPPLPTFRPSPPNPELSEQNLEDQGRRQTPASLASQWLGSA